MRYYTLFWRNTVYWTTKHISTFAVKARWLSRAFHSVAGLMRALMYYYTYSMRCNWWFWEKPLGIFKFSVSSFNFCVCRSVKIQNGNDNNVLHLVLTTSSSLNIEALMIKICFAQWPDNYNNYISTIIIVNCCTALYLTPEAKRKRGNTWQWMVEGEMKTLNHTWGTICKLAQNR